jgi:hypothetical protein
MAHYQFMDAREPACGPKANVVLMELSVAGGYHHIPRCSPRHLSDLLQMDLIASPKDLHAILGFLASFRRSSTNGHQQV